MIKKAARPKVKPDANAFEKEITIKIEEVETEPELSGARLKSAKEFITEEGKTTKKKKHKIRNNMPSQKATPSVTRKPSRPNSSLNKKSERTKLLLTSSNKNTPRTLKSLWGSGGSNRRSQTNQTTTPPLRQ